MCERDADGDHATGGGERHSSRATSEGDRELRQRGDAIVSHGSATRSGVGRAEEELGTWLGGLPTAYGEAEVERGQG